MPVIPHVFLYLAGDTGDARSDVGQRVLIERKSIRHSKCKIDRKEEQKQEQAT